MPELAVIAQDIARRTATKADAPSLVEFPIPFDTFSRPREGRPTKLTSELMAELQCLMAYTPIGKKHLCTLLGICHQTMRAWELRGDDDRKAGRETPHTEFVDLFEKGQAYWRARLLHGQLTGDKTWAKYATALERLWPEEFGRRNDDSNTPRVVVQIGVGGSDVHVAVCIPDRADDCITPSLSAPVTPQLSAPLDVSPE
jgi:hypothetical protein